MRRTVTITMTVEKAEELKAHFFEQGMHSFHSMFNLALREIDSKDAFLEAMCKEHGVGVGVGKKGETLIGFNSNRPKYPFSMQTVRGAKYKLSISQARYYFPA